MNNFVPKLGCLLAVSLAAAGSRPLAAGQTWSGGLLMTLLTLQQVLAGAPVDPDLAAPAVPAADADGLGLEPVQTPVSVWGDLRPLGNGTDSGPEPKRGTVSGPMTRALEAYPRSRCPGDRDWTLALPGGRGEAPPALEQPVQPDWDRYRRALGTTDLAGLRVAQARTLAADADYAFCRLVHRYNHPVERHRKDTLVRQLDDAMFLFHAMVAERRDLQRIQATFEARLKDPDGGDPVEAGQLSLEERLGHVREALEAIQATLDPYLAARMPKVDVRLQGRSSKAAKEEERAQAAEYARPTVKKKAKAAKGGEPARTGGKKLRGT